MLSSADSSIQLQNSSFASVPVLLDLACGEFRALFGSLDKLSLVISGGKAAPLLLRHLMESLTDCQALTVVVSDERNCGDPEAWNSRAVAAAMGSRLRKSDTTLLSPTFTGSASEMADSYEQVLSSAPAPNLAALGVGNDGHVASHFGNPVRHSPKIVEVVNDAPDPYRSRVTLSMPYLRSVPNRWAFILGREKRGLVRRLLSGDLLPVHNFAPTRWFIDQAALDVDSSEKHP